MKNQGKIWNEIYFLEFYLHEPKFRKIQRRVVQRLL